MKHNGSMVGHIAHTLAIAAVACASLAGVGSVFAAPTGESVQAGSANFARHGDLTTITASDGAIINYRGFNISAAETVRFVQPTAASRVLNRIAGSDPTHIDGSLMSNGIVYIVNPAGVYFGQGALVNVGGIYAGAAQLTNASFLAGVDHFTDVSGSVINRGTINGSLIALIGQHVANYGAISAPDGMVMMVAGNDVLITGRDHHFSVRITGMGAQARSEADPSATAAVENHGTIDVSGSGGGGKVVWGAGDVYAMGIFNDGTVKAATVEATATGSNAVIGGTIDVSNAHGTGGNVAVTATHVAVTGTINASGSTDGGSIKIGGDAHGKGELAHAQSTLITASAYLLANAMTGQGGQVVVWSDGNTYFYGTIEAEGAFGDNSGGFVETSGHFLDTVGGSVSASGGRWLLDPFDVELGSFGGAGNSSGGTFNAGNPNTWTASASPSKVDVADVVASLDAGTSVTINTTGSGTEPGDITVNAAVAKTAGADATFTLNADHNIAVNAAVSSTSNKLNVALNAANNVTVGSTGSITSNGGTVAVSTTSGNQLYAPGAINAGTGNVTLTSGGTVDESVVNQAVKITTTGTLKITAVGSIGNTAGASVNTDATPLFDVSAGALDLSVSGAGSNIEVKDHNPAGVLVTAGNVTNGFLRIDSVGNMTLADNAVTVANTSAGAGFVWLVSDAGIFEQNNNATVKVTVGTSSNLRIDAVGDVGTVANPLDVDVSGLWILMDRGAFVNTAGGTGSLYVNNHRAGTLGFPSLQLVNGNVVVTTPDNIDFTAAGGFDQSFTGTGNLSVTATSGSITATSPITMNGGTAAFNAGVDIGSSAKPIDILKATGLSMVANAGSGNVFLSDNTFNGPLADIAPATFGGLLITSANTHVNISSDGTDITFTQLQLPTPTGTFALKANSLTGNIHVADNAVNVPMTATTQSLTLQADTGGIDLGSSAVTGGAGTVVLKALGSGSNITMSNTGPHIISDATNGGRAELTANNSIGSSGSPVEFQYTTQIALDVNQNIYVKHDNTTDITSLSVAANPDQTGSTPIYSFENFALESYGDGGLTHVISVNDGSVDSLLLNSVETTSTGTSYAFTAKTGNLYVDDNGTAGTSPFDPNGIGNGGVSSGTGNVTLQATAGSVLPEKPRAALNIRTTADITPHGPVVTVRANTSGNPAINGSIGGDGSGDNFLDISGSRRLVLDARDHMNVRGNGQPLELLDITLDPDGPFVGSPLYSMPGFDSATFPAANFNVTSDGTDLFIHNITSTHVFNPEGASATEGTSLGVRARTGDIHVINIDTLLQGSDPLLPRSVTLRADLGSILLRNDAIVVGPVSNTAGNGIVRLNAFNTVGEDTGFVNTTVKVTTQGLLEMYANNQGGAAQAIGAGAADPNGLDVAVGELIAQAGMNLSASNFGSDIQAVQTATASGGIFVFDRDTDAQGLKITNVDTWNGDVDIRTAGAMTLADAAVVAGNAAASSGNGNVTLFGATGITETTAAATVNVTALGDQVALLGAGAIGSSATNGSIDIEAATLAGQVATNAGGFFVNDVDTALADGLTLNAVTDPQLGPIPGITTSSGAINVATVNAMKLTGKIATATPSVVTLTGSSITFDNAGAPNTAAPTLGGILDTGSISFLTDAVLLNTDTLIRTAAGSSGFVSFGVFALASQSATVNSTVANTFALTVNADGSVFFADNVGLVDRLSSLTARTTIGTLLMQGNVFTSGGTQNYFGPVDVMVPDAHFDDTGTSRTAGIHFHSTVDGFNSGEGLSLTVQRNGTTLNTAGTDPEVPTISFAGNVGSTRPLKWLRLNAYDANADGLFNNAGAGDIDGRADLPTVATIVVANEFADGSVNPDRSHPIHWLVTVEKDFSMGQNEKLTAIGSVTINANTSDTLLNTDTGLRLSDMNADRLLTLNAGNTKVVLLNTGRTLLAGAKVVAGPDTGILYPTDTNGNGALDEFADDRGLDFWARDGIHINNAASVALAAPAGPSVRWYAMDGGNISGTSGIGSTTSLGYFPWVTRSSSLGLTVLDLIPVNTDFNFGTIYPPPFPKLNDSVRLALTRQKFMNELLVMTRDAVAGERLRRVLGNAVFDDLGSLDGGAGRGTRTVLNRIREDMVPIVLHTYQSLFYQQPTAASGSTQTTPRFDQLRRTLAAGIAAYKKNVGQVPNDPIKFRTYFEQTHQSPQTLATLNALNELFKQMAQLGLTNREWSNALYAVAAKVTPKGVSPDLIVMAALGQPYPVTVSK